MSLQVCFLQSPKHAVPWHARVMHECVCFSLVAGAVVVVVVVFCFYGLFLSRTGSPTFAKVITTCFWPVTTISGSCLASGMVIYNTLVFLFKYRNE